MPLTRQLILLIFLFLGGLPVSLGAADSGFVGRERFPDIPYLELDDLGKRFQDVVVVDVRSELEFKTLHIQDAKHISLGDKDFVDRMKALRDSTPKIIVTYCNGKTCMKSFEAARACKNAGIDNVMVFDAGIFDWTKKHPDRALLLGKSPVDPTRLISKDQFNAHMLAPMDFAEKVHNEKALVLDVRDGFQRDDGRLFMGIERSVSLDDSDKLDSYIAQAKKENKPLLIYDNTGKQVEWLMYQLEDREAQNYFFMKGGANAYFEELRKQYLVNSSTSGKPQ
jgi:rhodanese-related sulfurtransferase